MRYFSVVCFTVLFAVLWCLMNNPYLHLVKLAWQHAADRRKFFVAAYVFFIISQLVWLAEPYLMGRIFNVIQSGGDDLWRQVLLLLLLYAALTPVFWVFHGVGRVWERKTAFLIEKNFREYLFRIVTEMPMRWHKNHHSGETHDKIEKAAKAIRRFSEDGFQFLETIIKAVFSIVIIVVLLPKYGFIVVVLAITIVVLMQYFDRILVFNQKQINKQEHRVAQKFYDYVSNIKTIITLRLERLVNREYAASILRVFPFLRKNIYINEAKWFSLSMLVTLASFLLMLLYVWNELRAPGVFMLGGLVAFYGYIDRFSGAFFDFAWQWEELVWHSTDTVSVNSITNYYEQIERKRRYWRNISEWKRIDIQHLWFRYEDEERRKHHLDDVNMTLQRGEKIALVGESGSGKSTLLTLFRGLESPQKVLVKVDDKSVRDMGILSKITTLIPQDPEIFDSTIEYNITAGVRYRQAEINQAIRLARVDAVIKRLPKGLKTDIKERGVNLSGGEKQRLALARGIFAAQDSSLILLDEPTSSVDPVNEMQIYKNLFSRFKGQCVVAAVHRLHLLPLFDMIYVLDQGKVVEAGSFQELITKKAGVLKGMWDKYSESINE